MSLWFGTFMGTALCKFFHSAQVLSVACSVINLVFISLDRCVVIWFPLRRIFTSKVLKASLAASWIYSLAFSMPLIVMTTTRRDAAGSYHCREFNWPTPRAKINYTTAFTICSYIIPLVIISIAYILIAVKLWNRELPGHQTLEYQKKAHETTKKAITMLVTVVAVFALCWLPLQAREFMLNYFPETISLFPIELEVFQSILACMWYFLRTFVASLVEFFVAWKVTVPMRIWGSQLQGPRLWPRPFYLGAIFQLPMCMKLFLYVI